MLTAAMQVDAVTAESESNTEAKYASQPSLFSKIFIKNNSTEATDQDSKTPGSHSPQADTLDESNSPCEEQLAKVKIDSMQKQVNDLEMKLNIIKSMLDNNEVFFRNLIMAPLEEKYDSTKVECYKNTVGIFDHESKDEMKMVYEIYYPLLENYGRYNNEVAELIRSEIELFDKLTPSSKIEKDHFDDKLEETEYFKKYRYKENIGQEIKYLEDVINNVKSLFEDSLKFKKENFEMQYRLLVE